MDATSRDGYVRWVEFQEESAQSPIGWEAPYKISQISVSASKPTLSTECRLGEQYKSGIIQ